MKNFLFLSIIFMSFNSFAFEIPKPFAKSIPLTSDYVESNYLQYDFEAIVKLSNCSGAVIRFSGQPDTSKAYVLTNGHCIQKPGGYLSPGEVWSNKTVSRSMRVFDAKMKLHYVTATSIVYATMTNTDSAIYELKETYRDLMDLGIDAYLLIESRPLLNTNIDIVSGYWDRGYRCHIDGFVHELLEGDWTFTDSIRYSDFGCETIGGTSGSPIIETGTRNVIGINNTGNKDGGRCTLNNPCESDIDGNITVMLRSYGQQTFHFYNCLTPDFKIDLTVSGCNLPK